MKLQKYIKLVLSTLFTILFSYGVIYAWTGLIADEGDILTADKWNEFVNKVLVLETESGDLDSRTTTLENNSNNNIGGFYQGLSWASGGTPQLGAWTVQSARSYGSDFSCIENSSECTVNFDGVVQVNWGGSATASHCISSLDKYTGGSWTQDIVSVLCSDPACTGTTPGFAAIEVSSGDKLRISTTNDNNTYHSCREDSVTWIGGVLYTRIK